MAFHRLTSPTYFGGMGVGYDYINNLAVGTPSVADGPKADGPNAGTYFVGKGEDALARAANRGLKALAQNTDTIDDILHRDTAIPAYTGALTAGAPVSSITITGPGVFLGDVGTPNTPAGLNLVFQVLDDDYKEIVDSNFDHCRVTAITGGTVGSGFSSGNVTLTISPPIPAGKTYRVFYATRGNLTNIPVDIYTRIALRTTQEVSGLIQAQTGASLVGWDGGPAWADGTTNPFTTVGAQLDKILTDLGQGTAGAAKISGAATAGAPYSLTADHVANQLIELLGHLNTENAALVTEAATRAANDTTEATTRAAADSAETAARAAADLAINNQIKLIPHLNWEYIGAVATFTYAVYAPNQGRWFAIGAAGTAYWAAQNGRSWTATTMPGTATCVWADIDTSGAVVVVNHSNASPQPIYTGATVTSFPSWSSYTPFGALSATVTPRVVFDPVNNLWCATMINTDVGTGTPYVFTSSNRSTWTQRTNPGTWPSGNADSTNGLAVHKASGTMVWATTRINGGLRDIFIATSPDGGVTWTYRATVASSNVQVLHGVWCDQTTGYFYITLNRTYGLAATSLYRSTDGGVTWTKVVTNVLNTSNWGSLCSLNGTLLAGMTNGNVYYSVDDGDTWYEGYNWSHLGGTMYAFGGDLGGNGFLGINSNIILLSARLGDVANVQTHLSPVRAT